jgi:hypothetical protein
MGASTRCSSRWYMGRITGVGLCGVDSDFSLIITVDDRYLRGRRHITGRGSQPCQEISHERIHWRRTSLMESRTTEAGSGRHEALLNSENQRRSEGN